jgi:hypothetical protein
LFLGIDVKIIDKKLVESVDWSNDQNLHQLCNEEYFIVVNPELDESILRLITIDVPLNEFCIKYKIGEGWIAKRFPKNWNGQTKIIQLPINPYKIRINKYADLNLKVLDYDVPAWDLPYKHVWTYDTALTNGEEVDAIVVSYIESASGRKVIGVADNEYINNEFDVIFLTYNETDAQANWEQLQTVCPRAKRVIGVKGIYNAHMAASTIAQTDMFYVVDADAFVNNFQFDYIPPIQDRDTVHIWYSHNPVNGLEYGYGGIKLFSKTHFQTAQAGVIDTATSVGDVKVMPVVACETRFNTDEFSTWKSAFRECAKLSSRLIKKQLNKETEERLYAWTTVNNGSQFGKYAISGALAGAKYGSANISNPYALEKINDYDWLLTQFTEDQK